MREEATFVQVLREKYQNDVAERILSYLLGQYEEWLTHTHSTAATPGRKAAGRLADGTFRELHLHEKLELLFTA